MSRVGRMPITVPQGVVVSIEEDEVAVSGPKGELHRRFHPDMSITLDNNTLLVSRPSDDRTTSLASEDWWRTVMLCAVSNSESKVYV